MPIYDYDGTTSTQIGKVYDYNGTTSTQIGKVYDYDGTTSTLIYSAEEKKSATAKAVTGWDNSYGSWAYASISIPVNERFRIDSITCSQMIYTNVQISVTINNGATTVYTYQQTVGVYNNISVGPYPSSTGYYTSNTVSNTVRIGVRGWRSSGSWGDGSTRYEQATVNVTIGV